MHGNSTSSKREKKSERVIQGSKRSSKQDQAAIKSQDSALKRVTSRSAHTRGMDMPMTQGHVHVIEKQR
jgi:hypothetical protein